VRGWESRRASASPSGATQKWKENVPLSSVVCRRVSAQARWMSSKSLFIRMSNCLVKSSMASRQLISLASTTLTSKPSNLLYSAEGDVVVADFGIAHSSSVATTGRSLESAPWAQLSL
jgi:hypothetical protein